MLKECEISTAKLDKPTGDRRDRESIKKLRKKEAVCREE
jgi:hypothetical protein